MHARLGHVFQRRKKAQEIRTSDGDPSLESRQRVSTVNLDEKRGQRFAARAAKQDTGRCKQSQSESIHQQAMPGLQKTHENHWQSPLVQTKRRSLAQM
jgi:hypothetical protein